MLTVRLRNGNEDVFDDPDLTPAVEDNGTLLKLRRNHGPYTVKYDIEDVESWTLDDEAERKRVTWARVPRDEGQPPGPFEPREE